MSYDLSVFDPRAAPRDRKEFTAWHERQTRWEESHGYEDPTVCTPELRAWFLEIIEDFPPLNGPYASNDPDVERPTDYGVGRSLIYAAFDWSQAGEALATAHRLAEKHRVGFFELSERSGRVWVPEPDGSFQCIHDETTGLSPAARFWRRFGFSF